MSTALLPAIAEPPPADARPVSAAELAARIPVPVRLPPRYDGEHLRHLSHSAYNLWVTCREAYRRKYICGEREPKSGAMFLGSRVDDTVTLYYRRRLAGRAARPRAGQGRLPGAVAAASSTQSTRSSASTGRTSTSRPRSRWGWTRSR